MWTTAEFVTFEKNLFIVLVPIIIVIGNIGSVLNVIVFSLSNKLRSSPCSLYLIFASIGYAVYLNIVALLRLLQLGFNIDPSAYWSWICKLRFYAVGFLLMLPRSYMLLAAIDRYLMSISINQHRFLSRHVAFKMIIITCLFWMIICIHNIIFYDIQISSNGTNRICSNSAGPYSIFLSFYSILINGLSMPLLMTIFGLLTLRNLKRHRNQINNSIIIILHRRKKEEWSILRMLLIQLIVNVILTLPITIYLCYSGLTQYLQKSSIRIFIENYIYNMSTLLQYINAAASFCVYSLTSHIFRKELYSIIVHYSIKLKQCVIDHSTALFTRLGHSFVI